MLDETFKEKDINGKETGKVLENRLAFTAHGEIIADKQKIGLDGIDTPLGGLSLVYDMKNSRFTGSSSIDRTPCSPLYDF
jgi:hypothetical protein